MFKEISHCDECGGDTDHDVTIEIIEERTKGENTEYSREPYRISTCEVCGTDEKLRMNTV